MKRILSFTFAFSACLLLSSCAELFQGKVSMVTGYETANLSDVIVPEEKIEQLPAPRQIFVSDGDSPKTITVSWTPVEGALSYRLERALVTEFNDDGTYEEPSEADYSVIPGISSSSAKLYNTYSFSDQILSDNDMVYSAPEYGNLYFYRVCAENELKGYTSSEFTTCTKPGTLFTPPINIQASAGSSESEVYINWTKADSPSVMEYSIYRSENEDGTNAAFVTSVKSNMDHYADPIAEQNRGVAYYYSLYSVNRSGVSSCASAIAMGYARAEGAPPQVENVHIKEDCGRGASSEEIQIEWNKDSDSEIHYAVYRSSSKDSALTLLSTDASVPYTDSKNLSQGVYYYYQVQSWKVDPDDNTKKVKGQLSDSGKGSETPCEGYILSAPASVSVIKNGDSLHTMIWTPSIGNTEEQAAYSYVIMGSSNMNTGFVDLETVSASELGALYEGQYYHQLGTTAVYYKIRTVNSSGEESEPSAVTAPAPSAPSSIKASCYANLAAEMGSDWACNANEVYPVKIEWTPPSDEVYGYIVYRSDKKDKGYKKLSVGNDEKTFIVTGTTFYDINASARPGKIYYYKVLSVNALEQGVNYSDIVFGYGALTSDQYMREYNKTVMNSQKKLTLMHKGGTSALGSESTSGTICGSLSYNASMAGLGARIIMYYSGYADYYIHSTGKMDAVSLGADDEPVGTADGIYFLLTGNTNTSASMDASGTMDGTVECKGMYPGKVNYDGLKIKGGAAGGGYYVITREGFAGENVDWTVGNE